MLRISCWQTPPSILQAPGPEALHLWWLELDAAEFADEALLDPEERLRARRLRDDSGRRRFVAARCQVRHILGHYLDTPPETLAFVYGAHGKPALDARHPALEFNLSHAAGAGLLAISGGSAVGVDLEALQPRKNSRAIAKRVFEAEIYAKIADLPEPEFDEQFIRHWTHFEARSKCSGGGVFQPLEAVMDALNFAPDPGWMGAVASRTSLPPPEEWQAYRLE
jgi:4'-phosphopantetheinyl transferase